MRLGLTQLKISHLNTWIVALLTGLIFFTPTNWFLKLAENQAYVHGLFSDYLLVKIYPTDILALCVLFLLIIKLATRTHLTKLIQLKQPRVYIYTLISLILILRPVLTHYPWVGVLNALRLVILSLLVLLLRQWWRGLQEAALIQTKLVLGLTAVITVLFQASLGLYQFFWQKSLLGYYFLGETQLAQTINIAHLTWQGRELILPYGTTAHPNVLAGSLVVLLLISWSLLSSFHRQMIKYLLGLATIVGGLALFTTASISGIAAAVLALLSYQYLKFSQHRSVLRVKPTWLKLGWYLTLVLVPIGLIAFANLWPTNPSILRRSALNQAATKIIMAQPTFGTGAGLFTTQLDQSLPKFEPVVFLQPVHHVPLLLLAQTGLVGVVWLWCLKQILMQDKQNHQSKNPLPIPSFVIGVMVLPLLTLDHYLLSLQTGLMLSALILWLGSWGGTDN